MSGRRFTYFCFLTLAAVIGGSVAVVMLSIPRGEQPVRLLLVTSSSESQSQAMIDGARTAAEERGVELLVRSIDPSRAGSFIESLASVIAEGIHGAVVSPAVTTETVRALLRASATIDIVSCGANDVGADSLINVGTNQYSAGRICGNLIEQTFPRRGRVVVILGEDDVSATRLAALEETLGRVAPDPSHTWELTTIASGHGNLESQLPDELEHGPMASCVVDLRHRASPGETPLVAAAAEKHGVQLITFDSSAEALAAVETGQVYAVICDNAFDHGYQAVQHLVSICQGSELRRPAPGHGNVSVPATVVRRGNVAEYRAHSIAAMASPAA